MMYAICLMISWSIAPPGLAVKSGELSLTGPAVIKERTLARITLKGGSGDETIFWTVEPRDGISAVRLARDVVVTGKPGRVRIGAKVVWIVNGKLSSADLEHEFVIEADSIPVPPPEVRPPVPLPRVDPLKSIVRVRFGNAGCTGTLVGPRPADGRWDVLCAAHCIPGGRTVGEIVLSDGRKIVVRVTKLNREADCAWFLSEPIADAPGFSMLAAADAPSGFKVWHQGFGVDRPGNREDGVALGTNFGTLKKFYRISVSSGDSGSAFFGTSDNLIYGTLCCTVGGRGTLNAACANVASIRASRPVR